jgi:hypothetical protein
MREDNRKTEKYLSLYIFSGGIVLLSLFDVFLQLFWRLRRPNSLYTMDLLEICTEMNPEGSKKRRYTE